MSGQAHPPVEPLVEPLTRREREILALLAQGRTAPEIAQALTLAVSSVRWYLQQVYGKLGVSGKQDALARAEALGLLAPPGAPAERTATAAPRHNLPLQVTRFFGREAEITQLKARLAEHRLVTLAGSGGVGKTRLSLQTAAALLTDFADGVWFAGLAPLTDPALVVQTVAASLGLRDEPGRPMLDSLNDFLRPRQVLLVFDNCEHLLEACAQLADSLLRNCPRVTILASSREPLGIAGEAVLAVPSLSFPAAGQPAQMAQLAEYAAVRLFTDRARLVLPDFAITPANAAAVARICQRLDGIPLAIEMAAARINLLSPEQLADRLDDAFRLLTGGSRTALPRQQTLRATLDWSYRLLTDEQRKLLQRLAVFAGGCTLEAAEAVCAGEGLAAGDILELLAALVAKSMVSADRPPAGDTRYHLLETVRQYAREKLNEAGETERLHWRQRDYFLSLAETPAPTRDLQAALAWNKKLLAEQDNLRQALEWSLNDVHDVEAGVRLFVAMSDKWSSVQELLVVARRGLAWLRAHAEVPARLQAQLLDCTSLAISWVDPPTGRALAHEAVAINRSLDPSGREALMRSLFNLASVYYNGDDAFDQVEAPLAEAESILQALGPNFYAPDEQLRVKAAFASQRARLAIHLGQYAAAKLHASECVRLNIESGSYWLAHDGHVSLGVANIHLGAYQEAHELLLTALDLVNTLEEVWRQTYLFYWLAMADLGQGNLDRALEYCRAGLGQTVKYHDEHVTARNVWLLAAIHQAQGQPARAARLAGAAAALFSRTKHQVDIDSWLPARWRSALESMPGQPDYAAGLALNNNEAIAYALGDQDA